MEDYISDRLVNYQRTSSSEGEWEMSVYNHQRPPESSNLNPRLTALDRLPSQRPLKAWGPATPEAGTKAACTPYSQGCNRNPKPPCSNHYPRLPCVCVCVCVCACVCVCVCVCVCELQTHAHIRASNTRKLQSSAKRTVGLFCWIVVCLD